MKTKTKSTERNNIYRAMRGGRELVISFHDTDLYPRLFVARFAGSEGVGKTVEAAIRDVFRLHRMAEQER